MNSPPERIAKVASVAGWAFAIVIAVNQIGIAATLVNTLFMAVVGAVAIAAGLAFGLGGKDAAGEMVRKWYLQAQASAPKIEAVAEAAGERADEAIKTPAKR